MGHAIQWLRSLIFIVQMYVAMAVLGILFFPGALASRRVALFACKLYCRWVIWTARWMVGLRGEVRGRVPTEEVLIAAKHQSFFDILLIFNAVPAPKFIMKRELLYTPFLGQYAYRIGCIPVDRGKRGQAIKKMMEDVRKGQAAPGQLVIYAQGTRVAPGVKKPYKVGTVVLYEQLGQSCVPAATNVGIFWPRRSLYRKPGVAVVEFLDPIPPGRRKEEVLRDLETRIEAASNRLMKEAGFQAPD